VRERLWRQQYRKDEYVEASCVFPEWSSDRGRSVSLIDGAATVGGLLV
jgi:hypothetical protein